MDGGLAGSEGHGGGGLPLPNNSIAKIGSMRKTSSASSSPDMCTFVVTDVALTLIFNWIYYVVILSK